MRHSPIFSTLFCIKVMKYRQSYFKRCIKNGDEDLGSNDTSKHVFCTKHRLEEFILYNE